MCSNQQRPEEMHPKVLKNLLQGISKSSAIISGTHGDQVSSQNTVKNLAKIVPIFKKGRKGDRGL